MQNEIEKMKCPYCGNEKDLDYDGLIDSSHDGDIYWADWEVTCPVCSAHFSYREVFRLERAYNDK